ncbi:hypothetical protein ACJIZ3_008092 [Penstemon smallii]|uniref:Uncharacterized protein n=1 Tax=Penstemon smallii TaxID=265156 RepID=A0ABD3T9S3_9LAMI
MAYIPYMHMFLFFLAFIVCLKIQISEGRQLRTVKEIQVSFAKIDAGQHDHARKAISFEQTPVSHKNDLQVIGEKQIFPPKIPTQNHEFSSSEVSDDFRPTTPGTSPGIGHSFNDSMKQKAQDFTSVTGNTDDFRPTGPGHSPGIGHALRNVNAGPNA